MRFALSTLLAAALALPVLAQPPREGERPTERLGERIKETPEVEKLKNRIKELEQKLNETKPKKEEKKEGKSKRALQLSAYSEKAYCLL